MELVNFGQTALGACAHVFALPTHVLNGEQREFSAQTGVLTLVLFEI